MIIGTQTWLSPRSHVVGLLSGVIEPPVSMSRLRLANNLSRLGQGLNGLRMTELARECRRLAAKLEEGSSDKFHWTSSPLHGSFLKMQGALSRGMSLEEVFRGYQSPYRLQQGMQAGVRLFQVFGGREEKIRWEIYGTKSHPAPSRPNPVVNTAGKELRYFINYLAGITGNVSDAATMRYYGFNRKTFADFRNGALCAARLEDFPAEVCGNLLLRAREVSPPYETLMAKLLYRATHEGQDWPLQSAIKQDPWDIFLLDHLRDHVSQKIVSVSGKRHLLQDPTLLGAVREEFHLEDPEWPGGRSRRYHMERWVMSRSLYDPQAAAMREEICSRQRRAYGWRPARPQDPRNVRLQWFFQYWMTEYQYGVFPTPKPNSHFPTRQFMEFAFDPQARIPSSDFQDSVISLFGNFFSPWELERLVLNKSRG